MEKRKGGDKVKLTKGGNWLKADQCKKGDLITFKDSGRIEESDKYKYEDGAPKKSLVFLVEINGSDKQYRMNTQSKVSCMETWGDETSAWVGKKARINIFPTPDGQKKMIVLDPETEVNWS
jgi:hypothetical protein